ncbi:GGDEF domain-containing protein [Marinomonas algarum]|uniref:diguanylate cyclase n=1 Tax=Marinomonas algarum TaxID=2883105 RepID=A0A9X1LDV8_9GAMM|nr:GGDEF domain-containing protein [Marinomonas algarum]MCB5160453.1 GGDEF domain-containing protein [Marinomonas algarum]
MTKPTTKKPHAFSEQAKSTIMLEGVYAILTPLKELHPSLAPSIDKAISSCNGLLASENMKAIYSQLIIVSGQIKDGIKEDKKDVTKAITALAKNFESFDKRIFNKHQERTILSLKSQFLSGELSTHEALDQIAHISQDISIAVSSAMEASYGGKSLLPSLYSEGVEKIMHADIVIATNRLGVDLDRLSSILCRENPKNSDIQAIREEIIGLKIHEGKTKFFQSMDILSRLSWSMHRLNDKRVEKDKEYLGNLAHYFKFMSTKIQNSNNVNDKSLSFLGDFETEFDQHLKDLESFSKSECTIEQLKEAVFSNIKSMQLSTRDFIERQSKVIEEQQAIIEAQQSQLLNMETNLASISDDLEIASKEILHDELSGLNNQRGYDLYSDKLHSQWRSTKHTTPLSIMMINVDLFKKITDTHGRDVGNLLITWMGEVLRHICKHKTLFTARHHLDDFVICTDNLTPCEVLSLVKRIQAFVQKKPFVSKYYNVSLNITVSVGLAFFIDPDDSPETVLSYAQKALKQPKNKGRNQVWVSRSAVIAEKIGPLKTS